MGYGAVWKIKMGLKCSQQMPIELLNTVLMLASSHAGSQTQGFSVFSATADSIQDPFLFSRPTQQPGSPAKA